MQDTGFLWAPPLRGKAVREGSPSDQRKLFITGQAVPESVTRTVGYRPGGTACRMQTQPWGRAPFLPGPRAGRDVMVRTRGG